MYISVISHDNLSENTSLDVPQLHQACLGGDEELVMLLLQNGADISEKYVSEYECRITA